MKEYEWKAGQCVAYFGGYGARTPRPVFIDRVTPSGRARIGGDQFDKGGWRIGGTRFSRSRITPWNEEHDATLKAAQISEVREALRHIHDIPADVVREAVEIVLSERENPKRGAA